MVKELEPPISKTLLTKSGPQSLNFVPLITVMPADNLSIVESATALNIQGYGSIERKEYYTSKDVEELIEENQQSTTNLIARARKNDPTIPCIKIHNSYRYTEEDLLKIMHFDRDRKIKRQLSQLGIIGHYTFKDSSKEQSQSIPIKNIHQKGILDALTAAGENGVSVEDLVSLYMNDAANRRNAISRFRHDLGFLRNAGCIIDNLIPLNASHDGIKAIYTFGGIKSTQADDSTHNRTQPSSSPEVLINSVPLEQAIRPYERNPSKREKTSLRSRNEILDKTVAYLLSKLAQEHPEEISRNVRVNLGRFLPPKTTLPEIFGNGPLQITDDSELKNLVIEHLGRILNAFWDQRPKITTVISEEDRQTQESCTVLKRRGRKIEDIIQDINRKLTIIQQENTELSRLSTSSLETRFPTNTIHS